MRTINKDLKKSNQMIKLIKLIKLIKKLRLKIQDHYTNKRMKLMVVVFFKQYKVFKNRL